MIVSWNWLSQYVRLDVPVQTLVERLALAGLNHESTSDVEGDIAIDIEVTSNRSDCLCHLGVAREIAALLGNRSLREPDAHPPTSGAQVETLTSVAVENPALCPRFTSRVITGATIKESPWWLRKRLETIGVRPVSNVVDVTNYVMFECGQPLHAYDLDKLAGKRLVIRLARPGESLVAINQKVYELTTDMLVIADAEKPVGLAGVMGGFETEIGPATRRILIESASFDAMSVRRTSRKLGLFSPSSYRFERPMDVHRTEWASRRCAELILETAGGTLHPGVIDVGERSHEPAPITLRMGQIRRVLGIDVGREDAVKILCDLGLAHLGEAANSLTFQAPSWRPDLEREIDLIEEVARVHGYEHIPEDRVVPLASSRRTPRERLEGEVRGALTGLGFDEACTISLVADDLIASLDEPVGQAPIRVEHSTRKRENALRLSLFPSLLAARAHNEARSRPNANLFEIANVYIPRPGSELPHEPTRLAFVLGGDFFAIKGIVEELLARFHSKAALAAAAVDRDWFAPGRAALLRLGDKDWGYIGEVSETKLASLGLHQPCGAAELDFGLLIANTELVTRFEPLAAFPPVVRDLSLVAARSLPWSSLANTAAEAGGPHLEDVRFLDTFQGGDLPPDQQSVHFSLTFRHRERTLTGDEVEQAVRSVIDACAGRLGTTLRA